MLRMVARRTGPAVLLTAVSARAIGLTLGLALPLSACDVSATINKLLGRVVDTEQNSIQQTSDQIDQTVSDLQNTSTSWQTELNTLEGKLNDDAKKLIGNDIQNLISRSIGQAGVEFDCQGDFVNQRIAEALLGIKAKLLGKPVPVATPHFCTAVPEVVDRTLVPADLRLVTFYGYNFDVANSLSLKIVNKNGTTRDVTSAVTIPTTYALTLNLAGNGAQLDDQSDHFAFYWGNVLFSSVAILQPAVPPPRICQSSIESVGQQDVGPVIPTKIGSGDNDFDGHGPAIFINAYLLTTPQQVTLRVYMHAKETTPDWTEAATTRDFPVYSARPNTAIDGVVPPTATQWNQVTSGQWPLDNPPQQNLGSGSLVQYMRIAGDQDGDDIGRTQITKLHLNTMSVRVHEVGDCVSSKAINAVIGTRFLSPSFTAALSAPARMDAKQMNTMVLRLRPGGPAGAMLLQGQPPPHQ